MTHAMPPLGLGSQLRREMGDGLLPVPRAPFVDLSTWAKIPFLYTTEMRRMAARMVRLAVDPRKIGRFLIVLEQELGHELAFAVERGKISANAGDAPGRIAMDLIESGLTATVTSESLNATLAENRASLRGAAKQALANATIDREAVRRVILVGGSSLMGFVSDELQALCPRAQILRSEAFTAVIDGLALAAKR